MGNFFFNYYYFIDQQLGLANMLVGGSLISSQKGDLSKRVASHFLKYVHAFIGERGIYDYRCKYLGDNNIRIPNIF